VFAGVRNLSNNFTLRSVLLIELVCLLIQKEGLMYKIEKKDYGFRLIFGGFTNADEMKKWVTESKKVLSTAPKEFCLFVDMRELKPMDTAAKEVMEEGQALYKQKGLVRSVVALSSSVIQLQFKRLARKSGIDKWERYIDASADANWEKKGIDWLKNSVDPD